MSMDVYRKTGTGDSMREILRTVRHLTAQLMDKRMRLNERLTDEGAFCVVASFQRSAKACIFFANNRPAFVVVSMRHRQALFRFTGFPAWIAFNDVADIAARHCPLSVSFAVLDYFGRFRGRASLLGTLHAIQVDAFLKRAFMLETLKHELRHVFQAVTGRRFDSDTVPYGERWHEVDARTFPLRRLPLPKLTEATA